MREEIWGETAKIKGHLRGSIETIQKLTKIYIYEGDLNEMVEQWGRQSHSWTSFATK